MSSAYIAPHKRRQLEQQQLQQQSTATTAVATPSSKVPSDDKLQRERWVEMTSKIRNIVNKINRQNFSDLCCDELFKPNLVRGRGVLCRILVESYISTSAAIGGSDPSNINEIAQVYIALMSVLNCQLPQIGKMFVARILDRLLRRLKRSTEAALGKLEEYDEHLSEPISLISPEVTSLITLLCGLANYYIVDTSIILQLLTMLVPANLSSFLDLLTEMSTHSLSKKDFVMITTQLQLFELSIIIIKCNGYLLSQEIPSIYNELLSQYRTILQELALLPITHNKSSSSSTTPDMSVIKFKLESLFAIVKSGYKGFPMPCNVAPESPQLDENGIEIISLNLIDEEDQITHDFDLSDNKDIVFHMERSLDFFQYDPLWASNEEMWYRTRNVLMGVESDSHGVDSDAHHAAYDDVLANVRNIKDVLHSSNLGESNETDALYNTIGFGGEHSLLNAQVDPEVEQARQRREIYLMINQSARYDETAHRLLLHYNKKIPKTPPELRSRFLHMVATTLCDSIVFRKSYEKADGLLAIALCRKLRECTEEFEDLFALTIANIRNKKNEELRLLGLFFSDLLTNEAIDYKVFQYCTLPVKQADLEDPVSCSLRVFLKQLLSPLKQSITEAKLKHILTHPVYLQRYTQQLFNFETVKEYRNAILFYQGVGLESLKDYVENNFKDFQLTKSAILAQAVMSDTSSSSEDDRKKVDKTDVLSFSSASSLASTSSSSSDDHYRGFRGRHRSISSDSDSNDDTDHRRRHTHSDSSDDDYYRRHRRMRSDSSSDYSRGRSESPPRYRRDSRSPTHYRDDSPPTRRDGSSPPSHRMNKMMTHGGFRQRRDPRDISPQRRDPRDVSPQRRDPRDISPYRRDPRDISPQRRDPRDVSPQRRDPRDISPQRRDPRDISPRRRDPRDISPQRRDPRDISPQRRDPRDISPQRRDPRDVSPQRRDPRDISPQRRDPRDVSREYHDFRDDSPASYRYKRFEDRSVAFYEEAPPLEEYKRDPRDVSYSPNNTENHAKRDARYEYPHQPPKRTRPQYSDDSADETHDGSRIRYNNDNY